MAKESPEEHSTALIQLASGWCSAAQPAARIKTFHLPDREMPGIIGPVAVIVPPGIVVGLT